LFLKLEKQVKHSFFNVGMNFIGFKKELVISFALVLPNPFLKRFAKINFTEYSKKKIIYSSLIKKKISLHGVC